jgi:hypothetical protein
MIIGIDLGEVGVEGPLMIVTMTILNVIHFMIMKTFHNKTLVMRWCVCKASFVTNCLEIFIASAEHFLSMILYLLTNPFIFVAAGCRLYPRQYSTVS